MCGIAGYSCSGKYEDKLDMILPLLGVFMDGRGGDSWGYTDGTRIHKAVGELQSGWTPEFVGAKAAALHTRYGTVGANTAENSHPWNFGDGFIGMHNGVVDNHAALNAMYQRGCTVDSQNLLLHIKERRDLGEVEAYGAVVFWRDGVLNLGCFNGGNLAVAKTPWGIIFASRAWAIDYAIRMAGHDPVTHYFNVEQGKLYYVKDGDLYEHQDESLNVGARKSTKSWDQFGTATMEMEPAFEIFERKTYNAVECDWCGGRHDVLFDTSEGLLCDGCKEWAMEYPPTTTSDTPITLIAPESDTPLFSTTPVCCDRAAHGLACLCDELMGSTGDTFRRMTVREYCESHEIHDLGFDAPHIASCDECSMALLSDDILYADLEDVHFLLCSPCHTKMLCSDAARESTLQ